MKRNILLLTAVVLAAVLMTGCMLPFTGVKVDYKWGEIAGEGDTKVSLKSHFNEKDLVKKVKKSTITEFKFMFSEADGVELLEKGYKVTVKSGTTETTYDGDKLKEIKESEKADAKVTGFSFEHPVLKDKIEITVSAAS